MIRYFPLIAAYANVGPYGTRGAGFHYGVDLGAPTGTAVVACDDGTVSFGVDPLGGNVAILHAQDGSAYYYAHMLDVQTGSIAAKAGDQIGRVDMSGNAQGTVPHCHFEWWPTGAHQSPAPDPTSQLVAAIHLSAPNAVLPVQAPIVTRDYTGATAVALGIVAVAGAAAWVLTRPATRPARPVRRRLARR